ncbi:MAG: DUF3567 family protein [Burkholderiales bacterium]|nr:DUF3567 family protein [Burkholderiales bacterium]
MTIELHSDAPAILTNVLFNSPNYYVAEVSQGRSLQGFEVVDKNTGRGAFIDGAVAVKLRSSFQEMVALHQGQVTPEDVDDFIRGYDALLMQRVVFH